MIGNLGFRAARAGARSYARHKRAYPSTYTPAFIIVLVLALAVIGLAGPSAPQVLWAAVILAVLIFAAGTAVHFGNLSARGAAEDEVLEKYSQPSLEERMADPANMRHRAALLHDIGVVDSAVAAKYAASPEQPDFSGVTATWQSEPWDIEAERGRLTAALFSVPCPVPVCQAAPEVPCTMGIGVPVALVEKNPVAFCHLARTDAAVEAGALTREELTAQFGYAEEEAK
jgi:hypothetical protein